MMAESPRQSGPSPEHQKKLERLRRSYERLDVLLTELEDQLPALAETLGESPEATADTASTPPRKPR